MSNYTLHGTNHHEVQLQNGSVHIFANDEVFSQIEHKAYAMADNNLLIPRNEYFSYTPDVHVGVGTCIGTTAVWNMSDGFVSPSIVGVDIGCGMRVHLTSLHKDELKDKKVRRAIMNAIEKFLPTNERNNSNYEDIDVEAVVKEGLYGLPMKYRQAFGHTSVEHVETVKYDFDHRYLKDLPDKIWRVSHGQIGSLGGGKDGCLPIAVMQ